MENTHTDVNEVEVLQETPSIFKLNEDTLLCIIDLLPRRDLARAEQVCTLWKERAERSWKSRTSFNLNELYIEGASIESAERSLRGVLSRPTAQLKSMTLDGPLSWAVTDSLMSEITTKCTGLTTLKLIDDDHRFYSGRELHFLNVDLKHLQYLTLVSETPSDIAFANIFLSCLMLKGLKIGSNRSMTGSSMQFINPTIEQITFEDCSELKDLGLVYISMLCSTLKNLTITSCLKLSYLTLLAVFNSPMNKSLELLRYTGPIQGEDSNVFAAAENISNCTSLKSLTLRYTNVLNTSVLRAIVRGSKKLEVLCLMAYPIEGSNDVTDEGLESLATCCPKLTELVVTNFSELSDRTFQLLADRENDTLTKLDATGTGITDNGFSALMERFPKLRELKLYLCNGLTTKSVNYISTLRNEKRGPLGCVVYFGWIYDDGRFRDECQACALTFHTLYSTVDSSYCILIVI